MEAMNDSIWHSGVHYFQQSGEKVCRNVTIKPVFDKEPHSWQGVRMRDIILFSAFAEKRSFADGPSVRIIATGLQEEFYHIGGLYCQMWQENDDYPVVVPLNFPNLKAALYDCLYRAGHVHRYVTISDVDEVLVPRAASTWPELMKKIASPRYGAYLFQHVYFRRNNTGEQPYLITQQSKWRTDKPQPPGKIRCKAMYNSDHAIAVDVHIPYELVYESVEHMLSAEKGLLHHYRQSPSESFAKHPNRYRFIEDDYMLLYKDNLTRRYTEALTLIRSAAKDF